MGKNTTTLPNQKKLPKKLVLLYGASSFGVSSLTIMNAAFLVFFYTQVLGIKIEIASTIILIAKIWDIINDPMMGGIIDMTRSKEGKCRVWLKYFTAPAGILFALTFMCPSLSGTGRIVWAAVIYILQGMLSTALFIPSKTLCGRITTDKTQRALLQQSGSVYSVLANLFVGSATMPLVGMIGKGDMQKGFMFVGILYGILFMISYFITFWVTKGYEPVEEVEVLSGERLGERIPLSVSLKALFSNKMFLILVVGIFMLYFANSLPSATNAYYIQYNLNNNMLVYSIISFSGIGGAMFVAITLSFFVKRLGNNGTAILGCVAAILGLLIRFIAHDCNMTILAIGNVGLGFGEALAAGTMVLNMFDAGTYGQWKAPNSACNEAILLSGHSMAYKIGMALGGPLGGYMLLMVPFVEGAAVQEESVINLFFYMETIIPCLMFIIPLAIFLYMRRFEKQIPLMRKEIAEREQKENA